MSFQRVPHGLKKTIGTDRGDHVRGALTSSSTKVLDEYDLESTDLAEEIRPGCNGPASPAASFIGVKQLLFPPLLSKLSTKTHAEEGHC